MIGADLYNERGGYCRGHGVKCREGFTGACHQDQKEIKILQIF